MKVTRDGPQSRITRKASISTSGRLLRMQARGGRIGPNTSAKSQPFVIEGRYADVAAPRASSATRGSQIGRHAITQGRRRVATVGCPSRVRQASGGGRPSRAGRLGRDRVHRAAENRRKSRSSCATGPRNCAPAEHGSSKHAGAGGKPHSLGIDLSLRGNFNPSSPTEAATLRSAPYCPAPDPPSCSDGHLVAEVAPPPLRTRTSRR